MLKTALRTKLLRQGECKNKGEVKQRRMPLFFYVICLPAIQADLAAQILPTSEVSNELAQ